MCFCIIYISFSVQVENFNIFVLFFAKIREIRYSCNVEIHLEDRAVMFA